MTDKKRGGKTKYSLPQHWRSTAAALLVLFALIGGSCARYVLFVSQTVYQESTSHLSELVHQSDDMLNQLFSRNRMILHLWGGLLEIASSDEQIRSGMDKMQKEIDCAALYFLASDGSCMTQDGEKSSLGSQTGLGTHLSDGEDIVVNAALPGKPQMLVFVCPETKGTYRGFTYDAVAIAYYNNAVLNALDNTAFGGADHSYVIYPDGRVVLDSSADSDDPVYNLLAELRGNSDLSEKKFDALSDDFAQGRNGSMMLTLRGTRYYLVYENMGIQDWIMLGLVPVSVVNAGMDTLWRRTVEIVVVIACLLMVLLIALIVHRSRDALRRRDTEILYRDELFTRLSRNVDDVFLMMDAETSRVDYVSPNIEQVQQDIRALRALHPKDSPDHDKNFFAGIQCGEQCEWNADYAHQQTGERRWFHVVVMGSEVAGRTKYILVMSDRTADRKINQALSEAVAAAEAASRAKSTFLSNMSHDIRTPMNAIIGFSDLLEKHADDREKVVEYIGKIKSSSTFLLSLINYVLEMARIESGEAELKPEVGCFKDLVNSLQAVFEPEIHKKNLKYTCILNSDHPYVICDSTKVREILLNIISNSIKYTPDGGSIVVDISEFHYSKEGHTSFRIVVADTGIGMSEEYLPHIFEEFTRERTSTESHVTGTGLGLPIVKALVDLMGGTINVESKVGQGTKTTIVLSFPTATEEQIQSRKEEQSGQILRNFKGKRILLAEDNELNAEIAMELLGESGLETEHVTDGIKCVETLKAKPEDYYDLILMDIQMPVMNGYDTTRKIRQLEDPFRSSIPIIAMTANAFAEDRQKALFVGMNDHVAKPVDMNVLIPVLEKHIRTKKEN